MYGNNKKISIFSSFPSFNSFPSFSSSLISVSTETINEIIECSNKLILENKCKEGKVAENQIGDIHNFLKDNIINKQYDKKNKIIETQNAIFQISTLEQQNFNIRPNISSIDLGECEKIIKRNIKGLSEKDELIILKTDIKYEKSTYVLYEIFNPYTLAPIDLSICDKNTISITVPVYLDKNIEEMNDNLISYGYNIFDENDTFYNDICSKYTTENGTDITLNDRRVDIYGLVNNISLCQKGCTFK